MLSIKLLCVTLPHMSISPRSVVSIPFQKVNHTPYAKLCADGDHQQLEDVNRACKKCHAVFREKRKLGLLCKAPSICPILAASSIRQRTCTGSLPPYTSSAFSQSRLKSCVQHMENKINPFRMVQDALPRTDWFIHQNFLHHVG